jgi:hypothetical protein
MRKMSDDNLEKKIPFQEIVRKKELTGGGIVKDRSKKIGMNCN